MLPAVAAVFFIAAAFVGALALPARRASLGAATRLLAGLGAAALLPGLTEASARPLTAFAVAVAVRPRPLPCVLASAAAIVLSLHPAGGDVSAIVAAVAAAVAAIALDSSATSRAASGADPRWAAVIGGAALCLAAAAPGGGRVLAWGYALGSGPSRIDLPGAGLLLGLALLASLAGTLLLAAHLLAGSHPPPGGRAVVLGRRLLLLGAGVGALVVGYVVARGLSYGEAALSAGAVPVAALAAATGLLALALVVVLGEPVGDDVERQESQADHATRLAVVLAVVAAAVAGFEGWLRQGTYATPTVAALASAALLGLAALQPTRLGLLRLLLFLAFLLSVAVAK